ncbi:MAG TPA: hypothetical protein VMU16_00390 [Candidatus Binataceae bacterium]|nr:hypothetical protein [Candidatus Binataceae bacterium]
MLRPIGTITWERFGYSIAPGRAEAFRAILAVGGAIALIVGAVRAWLAWREADNFTDAAADVDRCVGGHEQIVTLAGIAGPGGCVPERLKTPLFPILWARAVACLGAFNVRREFRFEIGDVLTRSGVMAAVVALLILIAAMGLVRAPSPDDTEAARLRSLAEALSNPSASPDELALADSIRSAADAIENKALSPEQKKHRIEEVKQQAEKAAEKRHNEQSGKDHGTGKSNAASANGKGGGKGGGSSASQGKSSGAGNSEGGSGATKNEKGEGPGHNEQAGSKNNGANGNNSGHNDKTDQQNIELQNELAKAQSLIESENAKNQSGSNPGQNPDQKIASNAPNPNLPGDTPMPGHDGERNVPSAGGNPKDNRDRGSSMGDTHLGEVPAPANFQRFLKPGEKGAVLGIHDARYVMFRIPGAPPAASGGTTVLDSGRPHASAPYVNAPLAPTRDDAPPDERQLVPPRYRDLIQ